MCVCDFAIFLLYAFLLIKMTSHDPSHDPKKRSARPWGDPKARTHDSSTPSLGIQTAPLLGSLNRSQISAISIAFCCQSCYVSERWCSTSHLWLHNVAYDGSLYEICGDLYKRGWRHVTARDPQDKPAYRIVCFGVQPVVRFIEIRYLYRLEYVQGSHQDESRKGWLSVFCE